MDEKTLTEIIEASASPPSAEPPTEPVDKQPIEVPAVTVEYGDPHTDELGTHTPANVRCGETVYGFSFADSMRDEERATCVRLASEKVVEWERDRLSAKAGS